jgi:hypothetical protein
MNVRAVNVTLEDVAHAIWRRTPTCPSRRESAFEVRVKSQNRNRRVIFTENPRLNSRSDPRSKVFRPS